MSREGNEAVFHAIECPECQARLKLRNKPTAGKKIICPKCQMSFVCGAEEESAPAASLSRKTPAPPPEEEEEQEEEPVIKPKKKKKKGKSSGSGMGLIIGLSVGGLILVGGLVWGVMFLLNSGILGSKHETIIKNMISNMNELASALESVKDEGSAAAAAPRIVSTAGKLADIRKSMKDMKIAKSEDDRLKKKYEGELNKVGERIRSAGMKAGPIGSRDPTYRDAMMKMRELAF